MAHIETQDTIEHREDMSLTYNEADVINGLELFLSELRPGTMQHSLLEHLVNKPADVLPACTYDLEVYNHSLGDYAVPNIWTAIGVDMAPFPDKFSCYGWAVGHQKSIYNAVYNIQSGLARLDVDPLALYVFSDTGHRDMTVVTFDPSYKLAKKKVRVKSRKLVQSAVHSKVRRQRISGDDKHAIAAELATTLVTGFQQAGVDNVKISVLKHPQRALPSS